MGIDHGKTSVRATQCVNLLHASQDRGGVWMAGQVVQMGNMADLT